MDFGALSKIFGLLLFSGILAYIGDYVGTKIGKMRLTFWGLRPRDTAILVTVFTGILIASVSLGIILIFSLEARDGLLNIRQIRAQYQEVSQRLNESLDGLRDYQKKISEASEKIDGANLTIRDLNQRLATLGNERTLLESEIQKRGEDNQNLQRTREGLEQSIAQFQAERLKQEKILESLDAERKRLQGDVNKLNDQLLSKTQKTVIFNKNEHLAMGVLESDISTQTLKIRLVALIHMAIERARKGGVVVPSIDQFWRNNARELDKTIDSIGSIKGQELVVVVSCGQNVVQGESLEQINFRYRSNMIIFHKGDIITRTIISPKLDRVEIARDLETFLSERVNMIAVEKGMLFDPMTKKIGTMDMEGLLSLSDMSQQIATSKREMELVLVANQEIPVAGPLTFSVKLTPIP